MLLSIALILLVGMLAGQLCRMLRLPALAGMILLAPSLLGISTLDAAIMGAVVGAVSPAVIVPKMIKLTEEGYGTDKSIPQLILAGASVDDVFVIVMFTAFTSLACGRSVSVMSFINIPVSILLGILAGLATGSILALLFRTFHMRDTIKVLIFLCTAFLLTTAEDSLTTPITFSSLIAVMAMGAALQNPKPFHDRGRHGCDSSSPALASRLASKFNKLWVAAEIVLFVLVGAAVDISYITLTGTRAILLIAGALIFRMIGVLICLLKTNLSAREHGYHHVTIHPVLPRSPQNAGNRCTVGHIQYQPLISYIN